MLDSALFWLLALGVIALLIKATISMARRKRDCARNAADLTGAAYGSTLGEPVNYHWRQPDYCDRRGHDDHGSLDSGFSDSGGSDGGGSCGGD